jgi:U3 small nucleolar RNA-associated protein 22
MPFAHLLTDGGNMDFTKLNAEIRIIPVLSNDSPIPISRLSPSHSNLRVAEAKAASADGSPSPTYNNALLAAFSLRRRLLTVHRVKSEVPAFNDALTLLRVWANQRGYGCSTASLSCLAGFEHLAPLWSTILELVIFGEDASSKNRQTTAPRRPLGKGLSSYQLFKASIDLLGTIHGLYRQTTL